MSTALTPGQIEELKRLKREPQVTYGSSTKRLQNALRAAGYAEDFSDGALDLCRITPAGTAALDGAVQEERRRQGRARRRRGLR